MINKEKQIPKIIHYCWYGKGAYNDTVKKCISSWKEKLLDYEIKKWDESNTPFDKFPFLRIILRAKIWSYITDFIRLYAIYTEGGIYLDTDIEIIKDFDDLLEEENFLGFEIEIDKHIHPVNSAVIGARKGTSFVFDCLKKTEYYQRLRRNQIGGPKIVSKVLKEYGLDTYEDQVIQNVRVLPKSYFHPFRYNEEFSPECIKKETICIHWWENSWGDKKRNQSFTIQKIKFKISKLLSIIRSLLIWKLARKRFYLTEKHLNSPSKL